MKWTLRIPITSPTSAALPFVSSAATKNWGFGVMALALLASEQRKLLKWCWGVMLWVSLNLISSWIWLGKDWLTCQKHWAGLYRCWEGEYGWTANITRISPKHITLECLFMNKDWSLSRKLDPTRKIAPDDPNTEQGGWKERKLECRILEALKRSRFRLSPSYALAMELTWGDRVSTLVMLIQGRILYFLGESHVVATRNWHTEGIVLVQR